MKLTYSLMKRMVMAMTKKDLIADMKQTVGGGGFITLSGIAAYVGVKSHHSVDKFVDGLERINNKYYFIPDVAEQMIRLGGVK